MKVFTRSLLIVLCFQVGGSLAAEVADTIYKNGRIYTVNESQPWAEAVAINGGKFVTVGSAADVDAVNGGETVVVDLGGQFVMPGIVNMHAHPFSGVDVGTGGANLSNPGDLDAVLADVKAYIETNPDKDVLLGGNWLVGGALDANDSPDKALLDEIAPDVPVFLLSQSGHSPWVNSKALEMAGIDASFDNTGAYIFDRYDGTNEPSGTVKESGMVLIMNELHYLAPEEFAEFLVDEIARYSRYGVTAIQPAEQPLLVSGSRPARGTGAPGCAAIPGHGLADFAASGTQRRGNKGIC